MGACSPGVLAQIIQKDFRPSNCCCTGFSGSEGEGLQSCSIEPQHPHKNSHWVCRKYEKNWSQDWEKFTYCLLIMKISCERTRDYSSRTWESSLYAHGTAKRRKMQLCVCVCNSRGFEHFVVDYGNNKPSSITGLLHWMVCKSVTVKMWHIKYITMRAKNWAAIWDH
jgi:hypothetical protein